MHMLGLEVVAYSTVAWDFRTATFAGQCDEAAAAADLIGPHQVDAAIVKAFADNPFSSVRELSKLTCLSRSTVHRRRTESHGFSRSLSSLDPPSPVRRSEGDQGQLVSR
jgi:hypothetical protein